jgi:hypothetical protein
MTATSSLADRGVAVFETELELLVDQYRGAPTCLPPQRIAEVIGRYFALECLRAYGMNGFAECRRVKPDLLAPGVSQGPTRCCGSQSLEGSNETLWFLKSRRV